MAVIAHTGGRRWLLAAAGAALLLTLGWVLSDRDTDRVTSAGCLPSAGAPAARKAAVIALLGDEIGARSSTLAGPHVNRLVRISLPRGRVEAERRLGSRLDERRLRAPDALLLALEGSLLAVAPGGRAVLALDRRPAGGRDSVVVAGAARLDIRCRFALERGVRYRGIALGRGGRLYAYGYRAMGPPGSRRRPLTAAAAVLTVVDTSSGAVVGRRTVRAPRGRSGPDWLPWWGAVSADGRRLVLSYHGSATTGADRLDLTGDAITRCPGRAQRRACVPAVHGAVEPFGRGFLATTGTDVVELSAGGRVLRRLDIGARDVHLMGFALDRSVLYVSSCGRRPAIERLDLAGAVRDRLPSGRFCGMPLATGARVLVLAATRVDRSGLAAAGGRTLRIIDLARPGDGIRVPGSRGVHDAVIVGAA
ncbi:MAG TPA: hypothetical protein VMY78_18940 [Solirubrobacteraceae bacterium]|nr:hypothetical protein [Solirubrobacteraceae bacterium]